MRFYDPRNIWVLAEVLTPASFFFINPVRQLSTRYGEEYREDNFSSVRPAETMNIRAERPSQLMLSYRQYSQLERKARDNYLDTLSVFIEENAEKKGGMIHQKLNHPEFWQKIISLLPVIKYSR